MPGQHGQPAPAGCMLQPVAQTARRPTRPPCLPPLLPRSLRSSGAGPLTEVCATGWLMRKSAARQNARICREEVRRAWGIRGGLGYENCEPGVVVDRRRVRVSRTLGAPAHQRLGSICERARTGGNSPHACAPAWHLARCGPGTGIQLAPSGRAERSGVGARCRRVLGACPGWSVAVLTGSFTAAWLS